jgi:HSP20 family protein
MARTGSQPVAHRSSRGANGRGHRGGWPSPRSTTDKEVHEMQNVTEALNEVKELYQQLLGRPAPEIVPGTYLSFPPGVDPMNHALEEVEQLKKISQHIATAPAPIAWVPRADILATKDGLVMRLEIPDADRDTLKVFVSGAECVVRGERKAVVGETEMRPVVLERSYGPFERRFVLPAGTQQDQITARYREGVLELQVTGDRAGIAGETTVEVEYSPRTKKEESR